MTAMLSDVLGEASANARLNAGALVDLAIDNPLKVIGAVALVVVVLAWVFRGPRP